MSTLEILNHLSKYDSPVPFVYAMGTTGGRALWALATRPHEAWLTTRVAQQSDMRDATCRAWLNQLAAWGIVLRIGNHPIRWRLNPDDRIAQTLVHARRAWDEERPMPAPPAGLLVEQREDTES